MKIVVVKGERQYWATSYDPSGLILRDMKMPYRTLVKLLIDGVLTVADEGGWILTTQRRKALATAVELIRGYSDEQPGSPANENGVVEA